MANISITAECDRGCSYCFARDAYAGEGRREGRMSLALFEDCLDALERSGVDSIRILGGEPTRHPDIIAFLEAAVARKRPITLFTNALMPPRVASFIAANAGSFASVLINATDYPSSPPERRDLVDRTMDELGSLAMPGMSFYRLGQDPSFLLDLIAAHGLRKAARLGIAQPCLGGRNEFLHPKRYPRIGDAAARFAQDAFGEGVAVSFDCGFVPCMFSREQYETLSRRGHSFRDGCSPVIDILPDGRIIPCYPLATFLEERLDAGLGLGAARERFAEALAPYRAIGVFRDCPTCPVRELGMCYGGCAAAAMMTAAPASFSIA
jgi:radical SAM protein with 4Fe4S-binding SPASM domain